MFSCSRLSTKISLTATNTVGLPDIPDYRTVGLPRDYCVQKSIQTINDEPFCILSSKNISNLIDCNVCPFVNRITCM